MVQMFVGRRVVRFPCASADACPPLPRHPSAMRSDSDGDEEEDQIGAFLDAIENSNLDAADALIGGAGHASDADLSDEEGAVMALLAESDSDVEVSWVRSHARRFHLCDGQKSLFSSLRRDVHTHERV